jgi:CRP-like cAMP-binding protein
MEGLPIEPISFLKLENLPPDIQAHSRCQNLATGETLFYHGDPATAIYVVESGRVRLDRYTPDGKFVTFQIVRSGEGAAVTALFDELYDSNAISEVPSRVVVYPKQVLLDALPYYPALADELMRQLVCNIYALRIRLELREIRVARDRILHYFRAISRFSGTTICFDRPFKLVALDLGLTPEVFYRTLAHLERKGSISRNNRQITLHDSTAA